MYDPSGFRDSILEGLNEAGEDLDAVSKFLDANSSKLDYRRYGGNLIEILIAGGLLGEASIHGRVPFPGFKKKRLSGFVMFFLF